jgi:hypothetical protein
MTEIRVQTLEYRPSATADWEPHYQIGGFKWKTIVWKLDDTWSYANAHDRVLESNGGHFNPYRFRFVQMWFDPDKHHLEIRDDFGRLVNP